MSSVLASVRGPADLRGLDAAALAGLCAEIRELIVQTVSKTGGHLGPNLGAVELTVALHRAFDSPTEPILFDVGHQSYVHKILTGRAEQMHTLRQGGGLSGYPSRAESPHDWIENSHASTALSYADGLAKAYEVRGERRPVVAVVGDGALTGGMCWEALNNIAASKRPVVIVINDNGRSYAPTIGGLAEHLSGLRLRPGYERILDTLKDGLPKVPVVGSGLYDALHGVKRGMKDVLAPQGLFEDLGLKYFGPVDGHDLAALEHAFTLARRFNGPVIVHCVTKKGFGYAPAENDESDQMHQSPGFDPSTGLASNTAATRRWTQVFSEELVSIAEKRDDIVAITAAMCEPTGLGAFARRFPERFYDVGIAEQHAITSAAGLAYGGLHPVVAVYATFLNRAFDQFLMDVALHRLPVTVVLDRAGITGDDGPSHNGVWDMSILGVVPGLRMAAPRDERTLRDALNVAVDIANGPSVLRFPKTPLPAAIPALRHDRGADVLAESASGAVDVIIVSVGAMASEVLEALPALERAGYSYRVLDLGWVLPVPASVVHLAQEAELVVTVEDGLVAGGIGSQISRTIRESGKEVATREIGVPVVFPEHGKIAHVRATVGLSPQGIGRRIVEWAAQVVSDERTQAPVTERTGSQTSALDEPSTDLSE